MKRIFIGALAALMLTLAGCGEAAAPTTVAPTPPVLASAAPTPMPTPTPPPAPTLATLAVCGDVMSHMPVTNDAWDPVAQCYDYTPMMAAAQPLVAGADYAVANLETTLSGGPKYSGYPQFNSPDALATDLKDLGFDLMLTANNHCLDKGYKGLCRTLDVLDAAGLAHVGTARSEEEAARIPVADVGGISVAFLGYTYGTNGIPLSEANRHAVSLFNKDYLNACATPDRDKMTADLAAARALNTDLIAVIIHWGVEYRTTQNAYQEELADLLIANGADLVLGGHPHVPEPMEQRTVTGIDGAERRGFVCYSLGNFISSQVKPLTDTTAVLTLELTRDNVTGETAVTDYTYSPMLMLRETVAGEPDRFTLLDAWNAASAADLTEAVRAKAAAAVTNCQAIMGTD
ncbi:MAG: CapA family protein [Pseudoflavonifractor sp.]